MSALPRRLAPALCALGLLVLASGCAESKPQPTAAVPWSTPAATTPPVPAPAPAPAAGAAGVPGSTKGNAPAASPAARGAVPAPSFTPVFAYADGDTIWALDATARQRSELVSMAKGSSTKYVAWSPDGRRIAFSALAPYVRGGNNGADLWVVNADGSDLRAIVNHEQKDAVIEFPSWSADGRWLYFSRSVPVYEGQRYLRNDYGVERVNVETGALERVLADAVAPALSPDGQTMAYLKVDGFRNILYVGNADGTGGRQLLPAEKDFPFVWGPVFSPDGKVISFSGAGGAADPSAPLSRSPLDRLLRGEPAAAHPVGGPWEIYSARVDGSDLRQITHLAQQFEEMSHSWSPDGSRIAFIGLGALNTIKPDGTDLRQLAEEMPFGEISWSPRAPEAR